MNDRDPVIPCLIRLPLRPIVFTELLLFYHPCHFTISGMSFPANDADGKEKADFLVRFAMNTPLIRQPWWSCRSA